MAQVFPLHPDPSDSGRATLIRTLAALPDDWTLLSGRRLSDDPSHEVAAVLIHPEIGIALVDVAPADPSALVDEARQHLEAEGFGQYFTGELPIVALSIAVEALDEAGERLAEAFDAAPRLSIADMDWADAVIELLLMPNDLAMAGADEPAAPAMAETARPRHDLVEEYGEVAFATGASQPWHAPDTPWPEAPPLAAAEEREDWRETEPFAPAEEPEPLWRLVADEPATAYSYRRSRRGLWAAAAVVVLILGLGAGAWQWAEDNGVALGTQPAGTSEVEVSIPPSPANTGATADRSQPAQTPLPPVRLAAKDPAKLPPAAPTPTRIEPLPAPKPPIQMAAKNLAEGPPPPPKPTQVEPLPTAVANTGRAPAPPAASAQPPAAERQVAAAPPRPRQKPRRATPDDTPARQLMERQLDREPTTDVAETPARVPVREARAHPPIDAGDLPPLEEGAQQAVPREVPPSAAVPAPAAPVNNAALTAGDSAVGPPTRLLGPPGAPGPVSGNSAPARSAAAANNSAAPNPRECRPYTADTTLSGSRSPVQGIACRGADGQWRLVSEAPAR